MATHVIYVPGAFGSYDQENFGGTMLQSPNVAVTRSWNNWTISDSAATTDMNNLFDLIVDQFIAGATFVIVVGHSRGAQVIYKLLRELLGDLVAQVDTDKLLLISAGNPERKGRGRAVLRPDDYPAAYPGPSGGGEGVGYGLPTGGIAPVKLLDISMQYDEWSDYPNDWDNTAASDAIGNSWHSKYEQAPELGLDGLPVDWNEWTYWEEGTVTYMVAPAQSLVAAPEKSAIAKLHGGVPNRNRILKAQLLDQAHPDRIAIESAYDRPYPILAKVS